jgi:hypothetical protein
MTLIYPNIVPENNLRLLDALIVKHGPTRLLSRFVLEGDKAARQMGLRLRLRHDFGELLYLNEREVAHGNWFKFQRRGCRCAAVCCRSRNPMNCLMFPSVLGELVYHRM